MATDPQERVYGVAELTRLIKGTLERTFGTVWVEGEISNVRRPSSGHLYFTIKDADAQISAVFFRGSQRELRFKPADGLLVRAHGEITVYERGGNYQLIVRRLEEAGQGALQARFEALKKKLQGEGLFDPDRKRPLPLLPQHVGVVTSPTGAAIRDILNVVTRRFPNLHVVVAPARVQGEGAAEEIAAAIDALNRLGGLDVLIVGRGGGSLEDLWCFNEEAVARAIARSGVPVISAVGHEIDFTISDFVADLRAPTPSAAAELVVGCKDEFEEQLARWSDRLTRGLREALLSARNRLLAVRGHPVFGEPRNLVKQYQQRLDSAELRMGHELQRTAAEVRRRLADTRVRIAHQVQQSHRTGVQEVRRLEMQLRALNPLAVLDRGYSVTKNAAGSIILDPATLSPGQRITTRVAKGEFQSEVLAELTTK